MLNKNVKNVKTWFDVKNKRKKRWLQIDNIRRSFAYEVWRQAAVVGAEQRHVTPITWLDEVLQVRQVIARRLHQPDSFGQHQLQLVSISAHHQRPDEAQQLRVKKRLNKSPTQ